MHRKATPRSNNALCRALLMQSPWPLVHYRVHQQSATMLSEPRGRILFSGECLGSDKNGWVAAVFCLGTWRFGGFSIGIRTKPAPKPGQQCLASDIYPPEECLGNGQNGQLMSGDIKIGALSEPEPVYLASPAAWTWSSGPVLPCPALTGFHHTLPPTRSARARGVAGRGGQALCRSVPA